MNDRIYNWKDSELSAGLVSDLDKSSKCNKALLCAAPSNHCWGKCKHTRLQCLKNKGYYMKDDKAILSGLERRYDSWLQQVHEGRVYTTKVGGFNTLHFKRSHEYEQNSGRS